MSSIWGHSHTYWICIEWGDPRDCNVIFSESGYIPEILKLLYDPQWVGKHMQLTLQRPKKETLPIVAKLLGGLPLEKGEEFEFFPVA